MIVKIDVTKQDFPKLFKEALKKKEKSIQAETVREGEWPFKVDKGTLWKIGNCILFECSYKRIVKRHKLFAINGNAIDNRRHYRAYKIPKHLKLYHNISSVNDVITYGLQLNENTEGIEIVSI
jgi:hypothetical protein